MILTPEINGGIARLIFDSGTPGCLILKSSFAGKYLDVPKKKTRVTLLSGFSGARLYDLYEVQDTVSVRGDGWSLTFGSYCILDDKSLLGTLMRDVDGLLPLHDSLSSVEIRFSDRQVIFDKDKSWGHDDISLRAERQFSGQRVMCGFPLVFENKGMTVRAYEDLVIDTGYRGDVNFSCKSPGKDFMYALENLALVTLGKESGRRDISSTVYYMKECSSLDRNIWVEHDRSVKDYTDVFETSIAVAGVELLKSFDLYIDMVKDSVYLRKIKYVPLMDEAGTEPLYDAQINGRAHIGDGYLLLMYMKSGSAFDKAGLLPGDIIVNVNDRPYEQMPDSLKDGLYEDALSFGIVRGDQCMLLTTDNK